ncbi:diguanylate cyclase [Arthrobacter sp. AL08]|uniref:diguanylate cyclase n=1 Tax=unclassified Arthrobacter TaxID=235627 RepID=UPI00249BA63D|nr:MULTISPECIES: diguanylate cyclase [unclassified Arthrobacter]MDI3243312.1 diguanylate cyclase [Arthrobacter sp. AL05]MDI3279321.1 diguanylate cyclase [Arthrobacter sp. AL08]WGZ81345.1 diguanylate cyclase [Arthrobacter sp. EM1]
MLLFDRFGQEPAAAERTGAAVGLLLIDLDWFREINDTFGHHYGDELLIGPLTTHVLEAAPAQTKAWLDSGVPLTMSVNLSARSLLDDGLPRQTADLLARHGVHHRPRPQSWADRPGRGRRDRRDAYASEDIRLRRRPGILHLLPYARSDIRCMAGLIPNQHDAQARGTCPGRITGRRQWTHILLIHHPATVPLVPTAPASASDIRNHCALRSQRGTRSATRTYGSQCWDVHKRAAGWASWSLQSLCCCSSWLLLPR